MSIRMPEPDARTLERRDKILAAMRAIVPGEGGLDHPDGLRPHETDGLTAHRQLPMLVVLPRNDAAGLARASMVPLSDGTCRWQTASCQACRG